MFLFENMSIACSVSKKRETTNIYIQTHIQTNTYTNIHFSQVFKNIVNFTLIAHNARLKALVHIFVKLATRLTKFICFSDSLCMYCSLFQWPIMYVLFFVSVTHYICTVLCFSDPLYVLFFVSVTHWWCFLVECHMTVQVEHHVSQWWQESPPLYSRWNTPS